MFSSLKSKPVVKIIACLIIQSFLIFDFAFAAAGNLPTQTEDNYLAPTIQVNSSLFQESYEIASTILPKSVLANLDILAQRITDKQGAKTGEVFIGDAIEAGANSIIAGHSEPRANIKRESNARINRQVRTAHERGLKTVILCVGETEKEKNTGKSLQVIENQVKIGLKGLTPEQIANTVIAYEPVWAIGGSGKGEPATPEYAQEKAAHIRKVLYGLHLDAIEKSSKKFDAPAALRIAKDEAKKTRIIYGGSADKNNAKAYLSQPDIDGLLVGSKSTKVDDFLPIIKIAQEIGPKEGRIPYIGGNWKTYAIKDIYENFMAPLQFIDSSRVQVGIAPSPAQITRFTYVTKKARGIFGADVVSKKTAVTKPAVSKPQLPALVIDSPRAQEIKNLLQEIDTEIQKPKTGTLPQLTVISDYHGAIDLFLKYIADAISQRIGKKVVLDYKAFPKKSIKEQLEEQGIDVNKINMTFMLLGDFLDRGPYGVKCFRAAEELINLGLAQYVTGNHDLWAFLNIMGYHLPTYKGYKFYGQAEARQLVEEHWDDPKIAQDRFGWWTEKLAEYNEAQQKLQKLTLTYDGEETAIKDIRAELKTVYLEIKDKLQKEEKELLEDLIGFYFGTTDVYTGFNAMGMMSVQWWEERAAKTNKILLEAKGQRGAIEISLWELLTAYTEQATNIVKNQLTDALRDGKWWHKVLNDINHQNYTSVEWWGKDWSSHTGWGTTVIDELNELEGKELWSQKNYIKNPHLQDLALFYRKTFTLHQKDSYGNDYTHGWLPIDVNTGKVQFTYKGITYEGKDVWKGLEAIQNDIRDLSKPLSELHEALSLVNSWYADKTTKIKPEYIKSYVHDVGLEKIYSQLGIKTWFTCHNPLNKLQPHGVGFKVQQGEFLHFSVDKGMSWKKFKDLGAYVVVGKEGIILRGFSAPDFVEIIDNPPTIKLEQDKKSKEYGIKKTWDNEPLSREDFLRLTRKQLEEELNSIANIDNLVTELVLATDKTKKIDILKTIRAQAEEKGVYPTSIHDFYIARGRGEYGNLTVPAINIRGLTYDLARAVFRTAIRNNTGAFIFEIAQSEIGYTDQSPAEYAAVVLAAALREGYKGPVFIQADHFQIKLKNYQKDPDKEVKRLKGLIKEAIDAGFYNIDLDISTVTDLSKEKVTEQQEPNSRLTAELTAYIRSIEPEDITISIGGEIGEIGKKNTTEEELRAFMDGYNKYLPGGLIGLSKISIQTGTAHGGVVLPSGKLAKVKIDFDTIEKLSGIMQKEYGLAGVVQHGASTLPDEAFGEFVKRNAAEVHLATGFQNIIFESKNFPAELRQMMYDTLLRGEEFAKDREAAKEKEKTEEQYIYSTRKKTFGPFKSELMQLPQELRTTIAKAVEEKFEFLFKQLRVPDTKELVSRYISKPQRDQTQDITNVISAKEQAAITQLIESRDNQYMPAVNSPNSAKIASVAGAYEFAPGNEIFQALRHNKQAVIAVNVVSYNQIEGHIRAAMKQNAILILEVARSQLGYALDENKVMEYIRETVEKIGSKIPIIVHGDHIQYTQKLFAQSAILKEEYEKVHGKGSFGKDIKVQDIDEEILKNVQRRLAENTKKERQVIADINERLIKAGFTSIAIDASTIFDEIAADVVLDYYEKFGTPAERLVVQLEKEFALPLEWGVGLLKMNPDSDKKKINAIKEKMVSDMQKRGRKEEEIETRIKELESAAGVLVKEANKSRLDAQEVISVYNNIMKDIATATIAGAINEKIKLKMFEEEKDKRHFMLLPTSNVEETAWQLKHIDELLRTHKPLLKDRLGIEVEVGHVDKKVPNPRREGKMEAKMTHPIAVRIMGGALNALGLYFDLIATNNGSGHGTDFDKKTLTPISQVGKISPWLTEELQKEAAAFGASIAQHGTSGSDMDELADLSKVGVIKFNIATNYQQILLNVMSLMDDGLRGKALLAQVNADKDALMIGLHESTREKIKKLAKEIDTDIANAKLKETDSLFIQFLKRTYAWGLKKGKIKDGATKEDIATVMAKEFKRVFGAMDGALSTARVMKKTAGLEKNQRLFYDPKKAPFDIPISPETMYAFYAYVLHNTGKLISETGLGYEVEMPDMHQFKAFLELNKNDNSVGYVKVEKLYQGKNKFFQLAYTANNTELLLTFIRSNNPVTGGWSAIIQPRERIIINGYGTVGKKVADMLRKIGYEIIGVVNTGKVDDEGRPQSFFTSDAIYKGYPLYLAKGAEKNLAKAQEAGLPYKGTVTELLEQLRKEGKQAIVVDASTGGKKEKDTRTGWINKENIYKPYSDVIKLATFQGGEHPDVAEASFSLETAAWEILKGKRFIQVVSCNTTGMNRIYAAIVQALEEAGLKPAIFLDNNALRRERDPGVSKPGAVDEAMIDSSNKAASNEVGKALNIKVNIDKVTTSTKGLYVHLATVKGIKAEELESILFSVTKHEGITIIQDKSKKFQTSDLYKKIYAEDKDAYKNSIVVNVMSSDIPGEVKVVFGYSMDILTSGEEDVGIFGIKQVFAPLKGKPEVKLDDLILIPGSNWGDQLGGVVVVPKYHHGDDLIETFMKDKDREILVGRVNTPASMISTTHHHVHVATVRAEGLTAEKVKESLKKQRRIAVVDFPKGIFSTSKLFEVVNTCVSEEVQGASHPMVIIAQVKDSQIPGEVKITYAVPQESDVVPENGNAIQAALGTFLNAQELAADLVDRALGLDLIKDGIEKRLPVVKKANPKPVNMNETPSVTDLTPKATEVIVEPAAMSLIGQAI